MEVFREMETPGLHSWKISGSSTGNLQGPGSPKSIAGEAYGAPAEANEKQVAPTPSYPSGGMFWLSRLQASLTGKQDSH